MIRITTSKGVWPVIASLILASCSTDRSVIEVAVPAAAPASPVQLAEATGTARDDRPVVRIVTVRDLRRFEVNARDPALASLAAGEVSDSAIRSRAIGREWNAFGMALDDLMLPEGVTVENLIYSTVQRALVDKGYRVASAGSPERANALPLTVVVDRLWTWSAPGLVTVSLNFDSRLLLHGDDLLERSPQVIEKHVSQRDFGPFKAAWTETVQEGLSDLANRIQDHIRAPSELPPPAPLTASSPVAEIPRAAPMPPPGPVQVPAVR